MHVNDVIATASGGSALKGVTLMDHPHNAPGKQALLRLPSDVTLLMNPDQSSTSIAYCFSTSQQSDSFSRDVMSKGRTLAAQIHAGSFLWSAGASSASSSTCKDDRNLQRKVSEACILHCIYVPTKSLQIARQNMVLSDAALELALAIHSAMDADKFLRVFNPFVSQAIYRVGGVLLKHINVKLKEETSLSELLRRTQKALSANASLFDGTVFLGASAGGSRNIDNERQASDAASLKIQESAVKVEVCGPTTARNVEEFQEMMRRGDQSCWSIIDKEVDDEGSLVPVWELLLQQHSMGSPVPAGNADDNTRDDALRAARILCERWVHLHEDLLPDSSSTNEAQQRSLHIALLSNARQFLSKHVRVFTSSAPISPLPSGPRNISLTSLVEMLKQPFKESEVEPLIRDFIKSHHASNDLEHSKALRALQDAGFHIGNGRYRWASEVDASVIWHITQKLDEILHPSLPSASVDTRIVEWKNAINDITKLWPQYSPASTFWYIGNVVADTNNDYLLRSLPTGRESTSTMSSLARRYIDCLRHRLDPHEHMHLLLQTSHADGISPEKNCWKSPYEEDDEVVDYGDEEDIGEEEEEDPFQRRPPRKVLFEILIHIFRHSELFVQMELCRLLLAQRASALLIFPQAGQGQAVPLGHCIEAFRFTKVAIHDEYQLRIHDDVALPRVVFVSDKQAISRSHSSLVASRVMQCDFVSRYDLQDEMCYLPGILPAMEVGVGFIKSEVATFQPAALTPWLCFLVTGPYWHPRIMRFIQTIADIVVLERTDEGHKHWLTPKAFWEKGRVPDCARVKVLQWRESNGQEGFHGAKRWIWGQETYIVKEMGSFLGFADAAMSEHHERGRRISLINACAQHFPDSHMHQFINTKPIDELLMNNPSCSLPEVRQKLVLQRSLVAEGRAFLNCLRLKDDPGKRQQEEQKRKTEREQRRKSAQEVAKLPIIRLFRQILSQNVAFSRTLGILTLEASIANGMEQIYAQLGSSVEETYSAFARESYRGNDSRRTMDALMRAKQKYVDVSIGIDNLWRELCHIYEADPRNQRHLAALAAQHLLDGFPLEIFDGDAGMYCKLWVETVLTEVQKAIVSRSSGNERGVTTCRIFVLSVIGVQSSGKSTLLNLMFGTRLPTSAGRCTRGVFMQLVPSDRTEYEYVLLLDTEGLRSNEFHGLKGSAVRDNRLATFGLLPADACILMVSNEDDGALKEVLPMVLLAFKSSSIAETCGGRIKTKMFFVYRSVDTNDKRKLKGNTLKLHDSLIEAAKEVSKLGAESSTVISKLIFPDLCIEEDAYWGSDVRFMGNLKRGSVPPTDTPEWSYGKDVVKLREYIHKRVTSMQGWRATSLTALAQHLSLVWECIYTADFELNFSSRVEYNSYMELQKELQVPTMTVAQRYEQVFYGLVEKVWSIKKEDIQGSGRFLVNSLESQVRNVVEEQRNKVRKMLEQVSWQKWKVSTIEEWERSCRNTREWYRRRVEDLVNGVLNYEKVVAEYEQQCKLDIASRIDSGEWRLGGKDDAELEEEFEKFFGRILDDAEKKYPRMADEVPRRVMERYGVHGLTREFDLFVNVDNAPFSQSSRSDDPADGRTSNEIGHSLKTMKQHLISMLLCSSGPKKEEQVVTKLQGIVAYNLGDAKQFSEVIVDSVIRDTSEEIRKSGLSRDEQRMIHLGVINAMVSMLTEIQSRWDADHNVAEKLRLNAKPILLRFFKDKARGLEATAVLILDLQRILEDELKEAHVRRLETKVADLVGMKQWASNWVEMRTILDFHLLTVMERNDPSRVIECVHDQSIQIHCMSMRDTHALFQRLLDTKPKAEEPEILIECVRDESTHFLRMRDALIQQLIDAKRKKEDWNWLVQKVQYCLRESQTRTGQEGQPMSSFMTKLVDLLKKEVETELATKVQERTSNYHAQKSLLDVMFYEQKVSGLCHRLGNKLMPWIKEEEILRRVKDRMKARAHDLCRPKCAATCPRCGSSCTRFQGHRELHDCIHQPAGLKGSSYQSTGELSERTCLQSVEEGCDMVFNGGRKTIPFSDFQKEYPEWRKPASTNPTSIKVRETVFFRYQAQLARFYGKRPCRRGDILATYDHDLQRLRNELLTKILNSGDFDTIDDLMRILHSLNHQLLRHYAQLRAHFLETQKRSLQCSIQDYYTYFT